MGHCSSFNFYCCGKILREGRLYLAYKSRNRSIISGTAWQKFKLSHPTVKSKENQHSLACSQPLSLLLQFRNSYIGNGITQNRPLGFPIPQANLPSYFFITTLSQVILRSVKLTVKPNNILKCKLYLYFKKTLKM